MDDYKVMKRAHLYIKLLANGIDPLTDTDLPNDTIINNERISKCLTYVAEILEQVMENPKFLNYRKTNTKFCLSRSEIDKIHLSETPIPISEIIRRINEVKPDHMRKMSRRAISSWLIENDYLKLVEINEANHKRPTEIGETLGINVETREHAYGPYIIVLYTNEAQKFILDKLEEIIEYSNSKMINNPTSAINQGKPWTQEMDDLLEKDFNAGLPINVLANKYGRNRGGIKARLKKLGLRE